MTKTSIIVGFLYKNIEEQLNRSWTQVQNAYIEMHTFSCTDDFGIKRKFFGQYIEGWDTVRTEIDIKPDTIAFVQRSFIDDTKRVLGIDINMKMYLIGINMNEE